MNNSVANSEIRSRARLVWKTETGTDYAVVDLPWDRFKVVFSEEVDLEAWDVNKYADLEMQLDEDGDWVVTSIKKISEWSDSRDGPQET